MRKLSEDEQPLPLCLSWTDLSLDNLDNYKFVLQENDTGEILVSILYDNDIGGDICVLRLWYRKNTCRYTRVLIAKILASIQWVKLVSKIS